jgi:molybdopterin-guanine dinucleotide biosynthesis protein A
MFLEQDGLVYDRGMKGRSAFVLAGGQSRRMGAEKALVELDGRTLLERALSLARSISGEVQIVGSKAKFSGYGDVVEDEFPQHGPLGGIHAALRASTSELNLMLAVDMPFVEVRFLEFLFVEAARHESAVVTIPRAAGAWQTLCAVYRKPFSDLAEQALRAGKNKIDPLFRETTIQILDEPALTKLNFSLNMFRNVNTPEELEGAARLSERSSETKAVR